MSVVLSVRISPQDMARLRALARPRERVNGKRAKESASEVVRRLIRSAAEMRRVPVSP